MSFMFSFNGNTSELTSTFFPPIKLDKNKKYAIALLNLDTWNSITNISKENKNNLLHYGNNEIFEIEDGAYEIESLQNLLQNSLNFKINITPNLSTLRCKLISEKQIDFSKENSVGEILGFHKKVLPANTLHISDELVNILTVTTIRVNCSIIKNSYLNGIASQILFHMPVLSPPGYRISSYTKDYVYLPLEDSIRVINNITIRLTDVTGNLLQNSSEDWSSVLHLKEI